MKLFKNGLPKVAIENEFEISVELSKKGLPVPEVVGLIETEGRYGIIYERVYGPTMTAVLSAKPWKIISQAQKLAELHKSIQISIAAKLPTLKSRLSECIAKVDLFNEEIKTQLLKVIKDLPEGDSLCHGDFHPDNVIISDRKVIVIDWMTAAIGNPLSDVARTSIILKFGVIPEHKSKIETGIVNFVSNKFLMEYLRHYLAITGVSKDAIEQWEVPLAAARLVEWIPPKEKESLLGFVKAHLS